MKSQTERPAPRSDNRRSSRPAKPGGNSKRYYRQTARGIEARRDGKPLIFGWGKHLSHKEKVTLQRRATWGVASLIVLLVIAVLVGTWINANIIVPGLPITTVNGHQIPQSQFRKLVALKTLLENNKLNGKNGLFAQRKDLESRDAAALATINKLTKQVDDLNKQIKALPPGPGQKRTDLTNQLKAAQQQLTSAQKTHQDLSTKINQLTQTTIPFEQQIFTQPQITSDSGTWLQDDELIREWLAKQPTSIQNMINPNDAQVNVAMNDLRNNVPSSTTYSALLSQLNVSDSDMQAMMVLILRRDNMQDYLAARVVSPAYQVHARAMTIDTLANAQKILKQLQADGASDFGSIAKAKSQDSTTASSGGDLGWLIRGQYAQQQSSGIVDNWLFDPSRYVGELSPILKENGAYHIVQILSIDPSRPVDDARLQQAKDNALANWLLEQRALPGMSITPVNQDMMVDPNNLPPTSLLPASAPSNGQGVPGGSGLPGQP